MNVSAEQLIGDESGVHRGLYLRVVDHVPWLRGFACDDLHVFDPRTGGSWRGEGSAIHRKGAYRVQGPP